MPGKRGILVPCPKCTELIVFSISMQEPFFLKGIPWLWSQLLKSILEELTALSGFLNEKYLQTFPGGRTRDFS